MIEAIFLVKKLVTTKKKKKITNGNIINTNMYWPRFESIKIKKITTTIGITFTVLHSNVSIFHSVLVKDIKSTQRTMYINLST